MMKLKMNKFVVFNENKIKAEHNVINYNSRIYYNGKVLGIVKNKIVAKLKDVM